MGLVGLVAIYLVCWQVCCGCGGASGDAVCVVFLGLDVIVSRLRGFGGCVICGGCVFALFTVLWVLVGGGGVGSGLVVYSDMGLVGCRYDSVWLGSAVLFGLVVVWWFWICVTPLAVCLVCRVW